MTGYLLLIILILAGIIFWLVRRQRKNEAPLADVAAPLPKNQRGCRGRLTGLQMRMTFSYVWITIVSILLIFVVVNVISVFVAKSDTFQDDIALVQATAQQYAKEVAQQAQGKALPGVFPYPLGDRLQNTSPDNYTDSQASNLLRYTNTVPYLSRLYPANQPISFALLIAPDRSILSSSYPARYAPGESASTLLPASSQFFQDALRGSTQSGTFDALEGTAIYAATSVRDKAGQPIGAIYVQVPLPTLNTSGLRSGFLNYFTFPLLLTLGLLILLAPLGGIFGFISTRGMVKRLKKLASATTLVADGDYQQRLRVGSRDELGQLEQQFNRMAEQLGASTTRQKELAEQNARLAERSRISRELHDAISQDLFSLSMLAGGLQSAMPADSPLQRQANILEQTTTTMIREMRALLLELRPTNLEQLGLREALEELATAYSTRLGIVVSTQLAPLRLEARLELALLRIAQEALSNAARHSNATEISLVLALEGEKVIFTLKDNGQGFQVDDEGQRHGLGLRLMEERVQELDGTLALLSTPGQGTTLEVHLPLEEETI